jgi:hypothetical protein
VRRKPRNTGLDRAAKNFDAFRCFKEFSVRISVEYVRSSAGICGSLRCSNLVNKAMGVAIVGHIEEMDHIEIRSCLIYDHWRFCQKAHKSQVWRNLSFSGHIYVQNMV